MFPDGLNKISDYAFSFCNALKKVMIPETVKSIGVNAFSLAGKHVWNGSDYAIEWPFVIHAPAGSYAETYAKEHNIPFMAE